VVGVFLAAIPFFLLSMAIEFAVLAHHAREQARGRADAAGPIGYELRDTRTSLAMGIGHLVVLGVFKLAILAAYAALWSITPLRVPTDAWWGWLLLFLADDATFYLWHRSHHRVRILWATHVVHHSSRHYNLSTALRQDWTPFGVGIFWLWLPLAGFEPWTVFLAQSWSLLYQFGLHTETVGRLPRPIELVFNTPSHHRVHHGSQQQYLDRNYGGILIVWDRLFGSFEPEGERVRYGLTRDIETFNPVRVAFHEYVDIWRDVRRARRWRDRAGHLLRGPGWRPPAAAAAAAGGAEPPPGSAEAAPAASAASAVRDGRAPAASRAL